MEETLKKSLLYYAIVGICAAGIVLSAIISYQYRQSVEETYRRLTKVNVNKMHMQREIKDIKDVVESAQAHIDMATVHKLPSDAMLDRLDNISLRLQAQEVTVGSIVSSEKDITLPVTLTGKITNYKNFINDLENIQSSQWPFFFLEQVSLYLKDERKNVTFEIKGTLKTLKKQDTP